MKSVPQENEVQINLETRQIQSTTELTLIPTNEMIRKKVAILTAKKKEHNAMHVCLETTKLNIAAKTPIYLYHTENRST